MNEGRVLLCAVLLAAGVAAAVAAATVRLAVEDAPRIASVRLAELATARAAESARGDGSAEDAAAAVRAWALGLEAALVTVAERHRVVLLPARAVAAGAPDLTHLVEAAMAEAAPGRPAPNPEKGR